MSGGYGLVFSFPDQSPSFVHGFEAGEWWQKMRAAKNMDVDSFGTFGGFPIHAANEGVIIQMAKYYGFRAIIAPCTDQTGAEYPEWTNVRFEKING